MRITRQAQAQSCAICERTLLMGERATRFSPSGDGAFVDAADLFNASAYRRTVGGIAKSLGAPEASIVPLSGVNTEVAITVAWDISWYQYRVTPDAPQPVRLEQRGHDPSELDAKFAEWNATLADDGRLVPSIER